MDLFHDDKSSLQERDSQWNEDLDVWNECPRDILINIFSFVDFEDLDSIRAVNKKWNILSYDKRVFSRRYERCYCYWFRGYNVKGLERRRSFFIELLERNQSIKRTQ